MSGSGLHAPTHTGGVWCVGGGGRGGARGRARSAVCVCAVCACGCRKRKDFLRGKNLRDLSGFSASTGESKLVLSY
jgi:hypothetical protein